MRYLRTNTAIRLTVGPFLDNVDGITPEVALTVTSEKLTFVVDDGNVPTLVLDTAPTASGGANDMVHITGDDSGFYDLELAAANVNYLGRAMLSLNNVAVHCPVFHEFTILPAVIYDSLILGTDLLQSDLTQILGVGQSATDLKDFADDGYDPATNKVEGVKLADTLTTYTGNTVQTGDSFARLGAPAGASHAADVAAVKAVLPAALVGGRMDSSVGAMAANVLTAAATAADFGTEIAAAVWDALLTGITTVGSIGKLIKDNIDAAISTRSTYAGGDTAGTTTLLSRVGTPSNLGSGATVAANLVDIEAQTDDIGAAGAGLTALGDTRLANLDATVSSRLSTAGYTAPPSVGAIADQVWDEAIAGHAGAGSTGEALSNASSAGDPWGTALPGAYGAGTAGQIIGDFLTGDAFDRLGAPVGASISADIAAVQADTDNIQTRLPTALVGGHMDSSVEAMAANVLTSAATAANFPTEIAQAVWTLSTTGATPNGSFGDWVVNDVPADIADAVWNEALPGPYAAGTAGNILGNAPTPNDIAENVWDEDLSIHTTAGSTGKLLNDNLDAAISTRASQTSVDDLPTNSELATSQAAADDATLSAIAALNNLSAAQVNAEVVDALNVDTYAEPGQEAPPATASIQKKNSYLYKAFRNKLTQDATESKLYADNGTTVDQKATVSDDGTTFTRGEFVTGP